MKIRESEKEVGEIRDEKAKEGENRGRRKSASTKTEQEETSKNTLYNHTLQQYIVTCCREYHVTLWEVPFC